RRRHRRPTGPATPPAPARRLPPRPARPSLAHLFPHPSGFASSSRPSSVAPRVLGHPPHLGCPQGRTHGDALNTGLTESRPDRDNLIISLGKEPGKEWTPVTRTAFGGEGARRPGRERRGGDLLRPDPVRHHEPGRGRGTPGAAGRRARRRAAGRRGRRT